MFDLIVRRLSGHLLGEPLNWVISQLHGIAVNLITNPYIQTLTLLWCCWCYEFSRPYVSEHNKLVIGISKSEHKYQMSMTSSLANLLMFCGDEWSTIKLLNCASWQLCLQQLIYLQTKCNNLLDYLAWDHQSELTADKFNDSVTTLWVSQTTWTYLFHKLCTEEIVFLLTS